ncbi:sugar transferase [Salinimicrobium terrae]|uniref:sugar transferase n=1 Tax=Salinimicrobium terrae TaxID=470866 RepID=UPI000428CFFE|nr:sugar transferase [Salinimicrobium terrae]
MYQTFLKPLIDFIVALTGLIILFPVFILVALVLTFANKDNPFFLQVRPGKNEKLFKIIKFKTMKDAKDKHGIDLPDDQRLTSVGRLVRKTSLDEIPQLLNVLKGDMSLIGPRPLLPEYLELYTPYQRKRHEVRPGITGWAAVNGRNTLDWNQKFELDVWYVKNISFGLDFKILLRTIEKVITSEGVSAEGHPTMPRFSEYLKNKNK